MSSLHILLRAIHRHKSGIRATEEYPAIAGSGNALKLRSRTSFQLLQLLLIVLAQLPHHQIKHDVLGASRNSIAIDFPPHSLCDFSLTGSRVAIAAKQEDCAISTLLKDL